MESIARLFKGLAEPVRLRILVLLLDRERCVCDLTAVLDLPQSTVSRHLSYLKNAGWVEGRRRGVWMYYRLAEMGDGLPGELRRILALHLPRTGQGASDMARLRSYLQQKKENACQ